METRELHNLVPAQKKKKKKSSGTVREKQRETGPNVQTERATNHETGTPDTLQTTGKKKRQGRWSSLPKSRWVKHTPAQAPRGSEKPGDAGWARREKHPARLRKETAT